LAWGRKIEGESSCAEECGKGLERTGKGTKTRRCQTQEKRGGTQASPRLGLVSLGDGKGRANRTEDNTNGAKPPGKGGFAHGE